MIVWILSAIILLLIVINVGLWRLGAVQESQNPVSVVDRPLMDAKERKAILKRLNRWKVEGKLSAEEFDTFFRLCESEWDG